MCASDQYPPSPTKQQLVSVVIPTRNRPELLARALQSVLDQTYRNIEIIVVDDHSDKPLELNKLGVNCDHSLIRLIQNPFRYGGARSRNVGVKVSRGNFICFLDDDDVLYKNKIQLLRNALDTNDGCSIAFGKIVFSIQDKRWMAVRYPAVFSFENNVRVMNLIHTNATLIKREVFDGVRFYEPLNRYQDLQFHIEASLSYKTLFVDECVAEWNVEERNNTITFTGGATKMRQDAMAFRLLTEYLVSIGVKREYLYSYYANLMKLGLRSFDFASFGIGLKQILLNASSWRNLNIDMRLRKSIFGIVDDVEL